MYAITITYVKPVAPAVPSAQAVGGVGIGAVWTPESYVDGAAMNNTVYDTNKPGFGLLATVAPYDGGKFPLPIPMAQFDVATATEAGINTFDVDTFAEAEYYVETGKALASQGFHVTVAKGGSV